MHPSPACSVDDGVYVFNGFLHALPSLNTDRRKSFGIGIFGYRIHHMEVSGEQELDPNANRMSNCACMVAMAVASALEKEAGSDR